MFESAAGGKYERKPKKIDDKGDPIDEGPSIFKPDVKPIRMTKNAHTEIGKAVANNLKTANIRVRKSVLKLLLDADVAESSVRKIRGKWLLEQKSLGVKKRNFETEEG